MQNKIETTIVGFQNNINVEGAAVGNFLAAIVPQWVKDAGGILSDTVQSWRLNNQINIFKKTKKICDDNNIPLKAVKLKFLRPLIEHSSLEEDESMQNRWAALLANAIKETTEISPSFIDILRQLTCQQAIILDHLYSEASQKTNYQERNSLQFSKEELIKIFKLTENQFDLVLDDLFRLNLCRTPASRNGITIMDYPIMLQTKDFFELTSLGFSFVHACQFNGS